MRQRYVREIIAARALLDWSQDRLASEAGVSLSEVESLEAGTDGRAVQERIGRSLTAALEAAGVVFLDGDEPGVKLRRAGPPDEGIRVQDLTSDNDD